MYCWNNRTHQVPAAAALLVLRLLCLWSVMRRIYSISAQDRRRKIFRIFQARYRKQLYAPRSPRMWVPRPPMRPRLSSAGSLSVYGLWFAPLKSKDELSQFWESSLCVLHPRLTHTQLGVASSREASRLAEKWTALGEPRVPWTWGCHTSI